MLVIREVVEEALLAARSSLRAVVERGEAAYPMGRGAYGDLSYRGDIVSEEAVFGVLMRRLSDVALISEERGFLGSPKGTRYWALIDPVDGSANMSRGIDFYSTGIAVAEGQFFHDIICSGVIDHSTGRIFLREADFIMPSSKREDRSVDDSGITAFLHHATIKKHGRARPELYKLLGKMRYFRVMGSALLEMCLVYAGGGDAYICLTQELRMHDIAPALYMSLGGGLLAATYPKNLTEERLDTRERFGIIICRSDEVFQEVLEVAGMGWHVLERGEAAPRS
jgi:myo-inositol-1(or 4)-monophosphatase